MTKMLLAAAATVVLAGCEMPEHGPVEHASQSIELGKSEMARIELKMGAGELRVAGGSANLMDANFSYDVPSWKPVVRYDSGSFRARVSVEQPEAGSSPGHQIYRWDLRVNDNLPLDVAANLGAGEASMTLGNATLRDLEINMGVGELKLDLRGTPKRGYDVRIHGGVGNATVRLPNTVAIDAEAAGGIGNISAVGLEKREGRWINPAHEHAPVTIRLEIKGGVGNISLIAE